jgi:hypothetical protein
MCGCLIVLIGSAFPRLTLALLEVFTRYNERAFDSFIVGLVGFLFLPYTTLAFVVMENWLDPITGFGWFVVALGFVVDLSSYVGGASRRGDVRRWR